MSKEHITEAVIATPPVTVGALYLFGISLPDWAAILACIYTLLMIAEFCVRKYKFYFSRQDRRADDTKPQS